MIGLLKVIINLITFKILFPLSKCVLWAVRICEMRRDKEKLFFKQFIKTFMAPQNKIAKYLSITKVSVLFFFSFTFNPNFFQKKKIWIVLMISSEHRVHYVSCKMNEYTALYCHMYVQ